MTAEDLMAMKAMSDGTDMSSYEHFMVAEKQQRDPAEHLYHRPISFERDHEGCIEVY